MEKRQKLNESNLIAFIKKNFPSSIPLGIGDDCALLKNNLLCSTDSMVENVHFDKAWNLSDVAYKLVTRNVSDVLSMNGTSKYILLSMGIPKNHLKESFLDFLKGLKEALNFYDLELIGGDICHSATLFFNMTILGEKNKPLLTRFNAKENDYIYVTGALAKGATGFLLHQKKTLSSVLDKKFFLDEFYRPHLYENINTLVKNHKIHSMMDLSDSLLKTIKEICTQSNKGFILYQDKLPLAEQHYHFKDKTSRKEILELALRWGEDYQFLFTSPEKLEKKWGYPIGKITKEKDNILFYEKEKIITKQTSLFEHF